MRTIQDSSKYAMSILSMLVLLGLMPNTACLGQEVNSDLPKEKQTTLGLYVTSAEAYEKWKEDPEKVKILDVRTTEEYIYIGHAEMAWNIPVLIQTYNWDADKGHYSMNVNAEFMENIKLIFQPEDVILVTCRSGGRSAFAVNQLAEAGYQHVFNITDGFEGDMVHDQGSVYNQKRMVNGWKNSGLPYTYKIDPKLMLIPDDK